jgi:hypothetical protein
MWTDRDQTLDINHNPEELWFTGIFGRPVAKPPAITKWEKSPKLYQVIDKSFPRSKASAVLDDLGIIALENARVAVKPSAPPTRQKMSHHSPSSSTRMGATQCSRPPFATESPLAKIQEKVHQIKQGANGSNIKRDPGKAASPKGSDLPTLDIGSTPSRSRFFFSEDVDATIPATPLDKWEGDGDDHHATNVEFQQQILKTMVTEPDSGVNEQDLKILSMYISLTASEFIYVLELQRPYDETRC